MARQSQDPTDAYDVYLTTCLEGRAEDPDEFLARYPDVGTEVSELVRALHREYADAPPAGESGALPFERLAGYRLVKTLGSGGMGSVYLAEQEALGRTVALKVVRPELGASSTMLRRFKREARAIARLRHPGIVSVYELGEDEGVQYIAMEFVPGRPLDEILRENEAIPAHRIFQWMAQVGRALDYAHEQGVIHRDVKPSNILITPDDRAVLLDFGIAFLTGQEATRLTQSFAGSPLYAAPEQISSGDVDERTDVYLLGVTTYECVTGKLPFHGGTLENVFRRVLLEDAASPSRFNPSLPRDADVVIAKAMEKKPAARYGDMAAFAADLEALSRSRPVEARAPGLPARIRKWVRRRPVRATILAALLLAALGVGAFLVHAGEQREAKRRGDAARLLQRARTVLAEYRSAREASKEFDDELRALRLRLSNGKFPPADQARYEVLLDQTEEADVERDLMFGQVLELLLQARELDREARGVDEVTARLWLERVEEARAQKNPTAVRRYRAKLAQHDPDGRYTGALLKSGTLYVRTDPPGFDAHAFRRVLQRDIVPDGDRRMVPVPLGGGTTPVPPGTWTLRVVRGAGAIGRGDQILEVCEHPIEGTIMAADGHGEIRRGDRLVAVDERRIALLIDAQATKEPRARLYVFERAGRQIEVRWTQPPIELLPAAAVAERGGVPARVYQHGTVRALTLPKGLVVRTTAAPLFLSRACLVGRTETEKLPLEPGTYVIVLRKPGYEDLILLQQIQGGHGHQRILVPNPVGTTPPGFVFIPMNTTGVRPYWMQEHEVTNAEYLEFLNDPEVLAEVDAAREEGRFIRYPRDDQRNSAIGGHWPRGEDGRYGLPADWSPDRPVMGLALEDAKAYARWRGRREGRAYRLPTRVEWRAAGSLGCDLRYPFGESFRPRWVSSFHIREAFRGFDPVMSFPIDESVPGVYDLCGNVTEWLEWDGSRGFSGMSAGGSAMRGMAWEFETASMHPRKPGFAGGDCGFRLLLRRADVVKRRPGPK